MLVDESFRVDGRAVDDALLQDLDAACCQGCFHKLLHRRRRGIWFYEEEGAVRRRLGLAHLFVFAVQR